MDWPTYYMGFAEHAAKKSKDSTTVGACLIGPDGEIRLTGFNGPARGVKDSSERFERPAKYLWCSHAEEAIISFAAREGIKTKDCRLYVTHQPCAKCSRMIVNAGIKEVVFGGGKTSMPKEEFEAGMTMFHEACIKVTEIGK